MISWASLTWAHTGELGLMAKCKAPTARTTRHLLLQCSFAVAWTTARVFEWRQVVRTRVDVPKTTSRTQIKNPKTSTVLVYWKYTSDACGIPNSLPPSISAMMGNTATMAAFIIMITTRATLTTPDLPPAEEIHQLRQAEHDRRGGST